MQRKRLQLIIGSLVALLLVVNIYVFRDKLSFFADEVPGNTQVSNLTTNWQDYEAGGSTEASPKVPKYEKFELTFDINRLDAPGGSVLHNLNTEVDDGTINPYWPYEEDPAPNQYFRDNHPAWDANKEDYKEGEHHTDYNGATYRCKKSIPMTWVANKDYDERTEVRLDGQVYKSTYNDGDTTKILSYESNDSNMPDIEGSPWELKGPIDILIPNHSDSQYWEEISADYEAVPAGKGISVDGLFTTDNWATTTVQPGFYYQDYRRDSNDPFKETSYQYPWEIPQGDAQWKIRFAPIAEPDAVYQYKIRITDRTGVTYYEQTGNNFSVTSSSNKGFVRVSPTDSRYFETSEGNYLPLKGLDNLRERDLENAQSIGVNFVRSMWGGSGITSFHDFFSINRWSNFSPSTEFISEEGLLTTALVPDASELTPSKGLYQNVALENGKKYRATARVKTVGIEGHDDYGVFLMADITPSDPVSEKITGDNDWRDITVDFISNGTDGRVLVGKKNITAGFAYCSHMSVRELINEVPTGPEFISNPDFSPYKSYAQMSAYNVDQLVESASKKSIYIKAILIKKNDGYWGRIMSDGKYNNVLSYGFSADANIYGKLSSANREYQKYYLRFSIARYGYSTAIHSFEYANECDPWSGLHVNAATDFSNYLKNIDVNKHLASSSTWSPFPYNLWIKPEMDYSDIHLYFGWMGEHATVLPGWDGRWTTFGLNYGEPPDLGQGFSWDTDIKHSGKRSLKMDIPANVGEIQDSSWANFHTIVAAPPGHTIRASAYWKVKNVKGYDNWHTGGATSEIKYQSNGDDYAGRPANNPEIFSAKWGNDENNYSYDWTKQETTFQVPVEPYKGITGLVPHWMLLTFRIWSTNSYQPGTAWLDDLKIEDITDPDNPIQLNFNDSFEYVESESYDIVSGHQGNSAITYGFQFKKPNIKGEIGIAHSQRFSNPYKGIYFSDEDQFLYDDINGVWWRKFSWSQIDPTAMIDIYWWYQAPMEYAQRYASGKSYLQFMDSITTGEHKLSNGKYKDAAATSDNLDIRVLGQKEVTDGKADRVHLWIDNVPYTWKAVVDHNFKTSNITWNSTATYASTSVASDPNDTSKVYKSLKSDNKNHLLSDTSWWQPITKQELGQILAISFKEDGSNPDLPPPVTGSVTIPGMVPNAFFNLEWWKTDTADDPATPTVNEQIINTDPIVISSDASGNLTFTVPSLVSDVAVKIYQNTSATTSANGTVSRRTDSTPLESASISITDTSNNTLFSTTSASTGAFTIPYTLIDGSYTLKIAKDGYTTSTTAFTTSGNQATPSLTNLDVRLTGSIMPVWPNPNIQITRIADKTVDGSIYKQWKVTWDPINPADMGNSGYNLQYYTLAVKLFNPTLDVEDREDWSSLGLFPSGEAEIRITPDSPTEATFIRKPDNYVGPTGRPTNNSNYIISLSAYFTRPCVYAGTTWTPGDMRYCRPYWLFKYTQQTPPLPMTITDASAPAPLATALPSDTTTSAPDSSSDTNDTNSNSNINTNTTVPTTTDITDSTIVSNPEEEAVLASQTTTFIGKVVDDTTNTAIADAEVTLYAEDSNIKSDKPTKVSKTKTDDNGNYGFIYTKEKDKDYTVAIKAASYQGKSFALNSDNPQTDTTTGLSKATPSITTYYAIIIASILILAIAITLLFIMKRRRRTQ